MAEAASKKRKTETNHGSDAEPPVQPSAITLLSRVASQNEKMWSFMCKDMLPNQAEFRQHIEDIGDFFAAFGLRQTWKEAHNFSNQTSGADSLADCNFLKNQFWRTVIL